MTKPRILVAGATGKTGTQIVAQLVMKGYPVRAFVHKPDGRSEYLKSMGAEVQVGDLQNIKDVILALKDVQRAYFCAPLLRNALSAGAVFGTAAQERHLEVVVALSQWLADPSHPSIHSRETWFTDRIFSWMPGVGHVTVNPGWFADNYMAALEPIAQFGLMPMPLGRGRNAPPSNEDIARVAVETLIDPASHIGKTYRPTGPKLLTPEDIAKTFAKVLGRSVRYFDAPPWMFTKVARALKFPDFTIAQVLWYFDDYKRDSFAVGAPNRTVLEVTGKQPEEFETIVRRYVGGSPLVKRSFGSLSRAIWGMAKITVNPSLDPCRYASASDIPKLEGAVLAADSEAWRASHQSAEI